MYVENIENRKAKSKSNMEKVKLINEEEIEKQNVKNRNAKSKEKTDSMHLKIGNRRRICVQFFDDQMLM